LAAYLGIDREDFYTRTKDWKIAIAVCSAIEKDMQSFNLQSYKRDSGRYPSNIEFIRGDVQGDIRGDLHFRIYLNCPENPPDFPNKPVFTPYLGCSEHFCKVTLEGSASIEHVGQIDNASVRAVMPKQVFEPALDKPNTLISDRIPVRSNDLREYEEYVEVYYPHTGVPMRGKVLKSHKVNGEIVYFF